MRLLLACSVLGVVLARFSIPHVPLSDTAAQKGDPPRPVVPEEYTSGITLQTAVGGSIASGVMHYDLAGKRYNMTTLAPPVVGNGTLQLREIAVNDTYFIIMNDRCQPVPDGGFGDLFSWVRVAKYIGSAQLPPIYDNRTVDFWSYTVAGQVILTLGSQGNNPVLLNITNLQDLVESEIIYFKPDFQPGVPPASLFVLPDDCFHPDPLCPNGEVVVLDAFIFHPANMFDLNNENVADILGDTVFICADSISNHTTIDKYQWVSRYNLQVWSGWGQYAECNRPTPNATGECIGSETFSVGREASFAVKEKCGQCVDNSDVGAWFSLPTAGQCTSPSQPLGQDQSKGECSWRILNRAKTIDGKCLLVTNGMLDTCVKEGNYPFTKSVATLLQSFESSDPSQGGCPNIGP